MISRLIIALLSNFAALTLAGNLIEGFIITGDLTDLFIAATIFTLINTFLRPLIKTALSPLLILTLGLFGLIINAGMLYLLDFANANVTIIGIKPLISGTLLITLINFIINILAKLLFRSR